MHVRPSPRARRQRVATASVFLVTGATFGTFAARVPAVQDRLELSTGQLGVAFTGLMLGAFAGIPVAGALIGSLGSRRLLPASLVVFLPVLAVMPFTGGLKTLTAAMAVFGAANSGVDVAINTQGAHVERSYGRSILSGLHAMFSVGALAAAGVAAGVAAAGLDVAIHFLAVAVLLAPVALAAIIWMTDEPRDARRATRLARPAKALLIPGLIAFCMVFAEDVANTWSAVYVRSVADAGAGVAAAGFAVYSAGMLAGRLVADRVVDARGPRFTLQTGAALATAGSSFAIAYPSAPTAVAGFLLLGIGLAPVLPVLYGVVGHRDPAKAGGAIAAVTTVGYLGSIAGPPLVGALSEPFGLRAAFVAVPSIAVAMGLWTMRLDEATGNRRTGE